MGQIKIQGQPGAMVANLTDVPAFPGASFGLGYPEAVGDAARAVWFGAIEPRWEKGDNEVWTSTGSLPGEVAYTLTLTPGEDMVEAALKVTNLSPRTWEHGMMFNCFQCGSAPALRDHDGQRHWVRTGGEFRRLIEVPRVCGPRPAIQLYSVEKAPPGRRIPFVAGFQATPDVVLEGWMAIQSRDGKRLAATVSKPALFLFQNLEYSCIHSAADFGEVPPGQSAEALNRLYFVEASLADWYRRLRAELG